MPLSLILLLTIILILATFLWAYKNHYIFPDTKTFSLKAGHFKSINGIKIHYKLKGHGFPVLLIHGIGASHYVWRLLTPRLSKKYQTISVDLIGFGLSDKPKTFAYDLDSQCLILLKLMEELQIQRFYIIGSSMGGAIALRLAQIRHEQVKGLVVISPAGDPKIAPINLTTLSFLSHFVKPLVTKSMVRQIMKRVNQNSSLITEENIQACFEPFQEGSLAIHAFMKSFNLLKDNRTFDNLNQIKCPTLILWGKKDQIISVKYSKKIAKKIPQSHVLIHPWAGHHIQEDDPRWTLQSIFSFLDS